MFVREEFGATRPASVAEIAREDKPEVVLTFTIPARPPSATSKITPNPHLTPVTNKHTNTVTRTQLYILVQTVHTD